MNWLKVSSSHLSEKKLNSFLSVLLLAFGVGVILVLLIAKQQMEETFQKNIRGVDMVVGAKGSPLQIILSSVYHIDAPTGNISVGEIQKIANSKMIDKAVPLSFGDSYRGFRIVGTLRSYIDLYDAQLDKGSWISESFDVVIGSQVASQLSMNIGDNFSGNHGLAEEAIEEHDDHFYKVVGILKPSNSVVDKLILTSLNSVWDVHESEGKHEHTAVINSLDQIDSTKEITSLLLTFNSQMAMFSMPRKINQTNGLQAALPAIEVNRLIGLLGIGIKTLNFIGVLIIIISAASVFISLFTNLKEKKYELALLRSFGASRFTLFRLILTEGLMLSVTGFILGYVFSRVSLLFINNFAEDQLVLTSSKSIFYSFDLQIFLICIAVGIVSSIIPAIRAYTLNISEVLSHE